MRVERAELARLVPLAAAHGLVLATLYVLKPVRNAVFLDRLGVAQLPHATIAVAIAGAVVGSVYARLADRVRLDRLVTATFAAAIAIVAVLGGTLGVASAAAVYAFYVTVALVGLVTTSLVWLLANDVFDARQARRLFGAIGATGIAGAVAGGVFTKWAVKAIGTEGLVRVALVLLAVSLVLVRLVRRDGDATNRGPQRDRGPRRAATPIGDIAGSDLLRAITFVTALGGIVSVIADIQFNDFVARAFASREEKAAFLGLFGAGLSALAFVIQLLVTPRVLSSRGVGVALLFLPIAMGGGSIALVAVPSLVAAAGLKLADGGLRHSIHKSASEILMTPLSAELRSRTKLFLDASAGTASEAIGALLVLLLVNVVHVGYPSLGIASAVIVVLWTFMTTRARRAYVGAFRSALERRELDLGGLETSIVDPSAIAAFASALEGKNERAIIYALDMLAAVRDPSLVPRVVPLLEHASPEVRSRAVRVLRQQDDASVREALETFVWNDPNADVRAEAMLFVARDGRARELLSHGDLRTRVAALAFIAEEGSADERALVDEALLRSILEECTDDEHASVRAQVARVLGAFPALGHLLRELTLDRSPGVVERAIESAGRTRDEGVIPWLLERLGEARFRKQAREALASFELGVLPPIAALLDDPSTPRVVRLQLPRVLAAIPRQEAVDLLLDHLVRSDPRKSSAPSSNAMTSAIIKALTDLRRQDLQLALDRARVETILTSTLSELDELSRVDPSAATLEATPASRLLTRAVRERRAALLERVFRLLGLLYSSKEMSDAYHGVLSEERAMRARAIEFVDNVVERRIASQLTAVLDRGVGSRSVSAEELLERLVTNADAWLRAVTVAYATTDPNPNERLRAALARCLDDPELVVREAARPRLEPMAEP